MVPTVHCGCCVVQPVLSELVGQTLAGTRSKRLSVSLGEHMLGLGVAADSLPLRCVDLPLVEVGGHGVHSSLVHVHLVDL